MSTQTAKVTKNANPAQSAVEEKPVKDNPPVEANVPKEKDETKADKFRRLAVSRTGKSIAAIKNLIPLSNRSNYEYTPEQVKRIVTALSDAIMDVTKAFSQDRTVKSEFTL